MLVLARVVELFADFGRRFAEMEGLGCGYDVRVPAEPEMIIA